MHCVLFLARAVSKVDSAGFPIGRRIKAWGRPRRMPCQKYVNTAPAAGKARHSLTRRLGEIVLEISLKMANMIQH